MIGVFCGTTGLPLTGVFRSLAYFGSSEVLAIILVMTRTYGVSSFYDLFTKKQLTKGKKEVFEGKIES